MNYTSTVDARYMPGRSTTGANNDRATTDMIQRRRDKRAQERKLCKQYSAREMRRATGWYDYTRTCQRLEEHGSIVKSIMQETV